MSHPDILEQQPLSLAELKETLTHIQERDEELSFRAGKTMDHLNHVTSQQVKEKKELLDKLTGLDVPRLKEFHIIKIIDLQPKNVKELNVVLSGYTLTVNKEYQQKIIDALNE